MANNSVLAGTCAVTSKVTAANDIVICDRAITSNGTPDGNGSAAGNGIMAGNVTTAEEDTTTGDGEAGDVVVGDSRRRYRRQGGRCGRRAQGLERRFAASGIVSTATNMAPRPATQLRSASMWRPVMVSRLATESWLETR